MLTIKNSGGSRKTGVNVYINYDKLSNKANDIFLTVPFALSSFEPHYQKKHEENNKYTTEKFNYDEIAPLFQNKGASGNGTYMSYWIINDTQLEKYSFSPTNSTISKFTIPDQQAQLQKVIIDTENPNFIHCLSKDKHFIFNDAKQNWEDNGHNYCNISISSNNSQYIFQNNNLFCIDDITVHKFDTNEKKWSAKVSTLTKTVGQLYSFNNILFYISDDGGIFATGGVLDGGGETQISFQEMDEKIKNYSTFESQIISGGNNYIYYYGPNMTFGTSGGYGLYQFIEEDDQYIKLTEIGGLPGLPVNIDTDDTDGPSGSYISLVRPALILLSNNIPYYLAYKDFFQIRPISSNIYWYKSGYFNYKIATDSSWTEE